MKYEYTTCIFTCFSDWDDMINRLNSLGELGWKSYHVNAGWIFERHYMIRDMERKVNVRT